jgi:hypothetical protein
MRVCKPSPPPPNAGNAQHDQATSAAPVGSGTAKPVRPATIGQ